MEHVSNLLTTAKSPPVFPRASPGQETVEDSAPSVDGAKADFPATAVAIRQVQANAEPGKADSSAQQQQQYPRKMQEAVKNANDFFQSAKRTLQFTIHEGDGRVVVQIKDEKSGQIVRQIPSEDVLELAKRLDELSGLLFKEKA
jgi:flagellar protein FlaG